MAKPLRAIVNSGVGGHDFLTMRKWSPARMLGTSQIERAWKTGTGQNLYKRAKGIAQIATGQKDTTGRGKLWLKSAVGLYNNPALTALRRARTGYKRAKAAGTSGIVGAIKNNVPTPLGLRAVTNPMSIVHGMKNQFLNSIGMVHQKRPRKRATSKAFSPDTDFHKVFGLEK
jgi:hypothetical protein